MWNRWYTQPRERDKKGEQLVHSVSVNDENQKRQVDVQFYIEQNCIIEQTTRPVYTWIIFEFDKKTSCSFWTMRG